MYLRYLITLSILISSIEAFPQNALKITFDSTVKGCTNLDTCSFVNISITNAYKADVTGYLGIEVQDSLTWSLWDYDIFSKDGNTQPILLQSSVTSEFSVPVIGFNIKSLKANSNLKKYRFIFNYNNPAKPIKLKVPGKPTVSSFEMDAVNSSEYQFCRDMFENTYESKILNRSIPVLFYDTSDSINNCQQVTFEQLDTIFKSTLEDAHKKIFHFYSKKYPETLKQLERYGLNVADIEKIMPKPSNADDLLKHYKLTFVGIPGKDECVEGLLILYFDVSWDGASALPVLIKENKVIKVGNIEFEN